MVDNPGEILMPSARRYRHVDLEDGEPNDDFLLNGRPWRTYVVVPLWIKGEDRGFAGEMSLLAFYQRKGSNIRGSALVEFSVQIAAALAITLAICWLLARYWGRAGSWRFVALLSAGGGVIGGVLLALRPPDVGGYNEPLDLVSSIMMVCMIAGVLGITGCFFAWLRELPERRASRRLLLTLFVGLFVMLVMLGMTTKWSAFSWPAWVAKGQLSSGQRFQTTFYIYFATSVALPLVLYQEPGVYADRLSAVRGYARRLFAMSAFSGLLAFLVAFATGNLLGIVRPGQILSGFVKPAGGLGLWIISLFIIAGLSIALTVGASPRWVQDLNRDLSRFSDEADAVARVRCQRRILLIVFTYAETFDVHARHLIFAARQLPRIIRPCLDQPFELEQFADLPAGGAGEVRRRFVLALEKLARIDRQESRMGVPLLLVDVHARSLVEGQLGVSCFVDPGTRNGTGVDVCLRGVLLDPVHSLRRRVRELVDLVEHEVAPLARGYAFERHRVEVDFRYDQAEELIGDSYELPLALMLVGLIIEGRPLWESWTASGQVSRGTWRLEVAHLDIKSECLRSGSPRALLISAAESVRACEALPDTISRLIPEQQRYEPEQVRRDALQALTADRAVLIGVSTLQQAVEILYGIRLTTPSPRP